MQLEKYIDKLKAIDQKIRLRATGTPDDFAESLGMSKRSMYRYVDYLKDIGAPITYDIAQRTFFYTKPVTLNLQIGIEPLDNETLKHSYGGKINSSYFYPKNNLNFSSECHFLAQA